MGIVSFGFMVFVPIDFHCNENINLKQHWHQHLASRSPLNCHIVLIIKTILDVFQEIMELLYNIVTLFKDINRDGDILLWLCVYVANRWHSPHRCCRCPIFVGTCSLAISAYPWGVAGGFTVGIGLYQYLPLPTAFRMTSTSIHCFEVLGWLVARR